jgi:hypothetical protein
MNEPVELTRQVSFPNGKMNDPAPGFYNPGTNGEFQLASSVQGFWPMLFDLDSFWKIQSTAAS